MRASLHFNCLIILNVFSSVHLLTLPLGGLLPHLVSLDFVPGFFCKLSLSLRGLFSSCGIPEIPCRVKQTVNTVLYVLSWGPSGTVIRRLGLH